MGITRERICLYTPSHPFRRSMTDIIECAAELGLGGVEFRSFCEEMREPDRNRARTLGQQTRALGLKIPCFSVSCDFVNDPEGVLKRLHGYAEICSDLEIPYLHHTVAYAFDHDISEEERERRFQICIEPVLTICEYADRLGVRTLIEDQGYVFNGVENCERLCELSSGRIGVVADVGNIFFMDQAPQDFIHVMGKRIVHAHVKDFMRCETEPEVYQYRSRSGAYLSSAEIGTGIVDLISVKRAFEDIAYGGMFSLEFSRVADDKEAERVLARILD